MGVIALEQGGLTPAKGEVLVTGANGGVGSIAIAMLSALGFRVVADEGVAFVAMHSPDQVAAIELGTGDIAWTVDEPAQRLRLTWTERNGPAVQPPERHSFGTRLIERSLAQDLNGEVRIAFTETGVVCTVDAPVG